MLGLLFALAFAAFALAAPAACPVDSVGNAVLNTINPLRANCDAPPVQWSTEIAQWAQRSADACQGHEYKDPDGKGFMTNLMSGGTLEKQSPTEAFTGSVSGWYREWTVFDAGNLWGDKDPTKTCNGMDFDGKPWGHFTLGAPIEDC